jgi:anthranilate phosphoribosyltransferase
VILAGPVATYFRTCGPLTARDFPAVVEKLRRGVNLTPVEAHCAIRSLLSESIADPFKADFLLALRRKGETAQEMAAFALTLRELCVQPRVGPEDVGGVLMDVCGSGGDQLHTFNISTAVAFVLAGAGVPVAKHGNRAITSRCGSADVLEALGVQIEMAPAVAARCLREVGITFFFAPFYHRAFKNIAPVRQRLAAAGETTVFNFLGPLLCPARPNIQLIGVPNPALARPLAEALQLMGARRGVVASGRTEDGCGMDECSTLGPTRLCEFDGAGAITEATLDAAALGLPRAGLASLAGGSRDDNAGIIRCILTGTESGPRRDIVLLNAAVALRIAGRVATDAEGLKLAAEVIDCGAAADKLERLAMASRAQGA